MDFVKLVIREIRVHFFGDVTVHVFGEETVTHSSARGQLHIIFASPNVVMFHSLFW